MQPDLQYVRTGRLIHELTWRVPRVIRRYLRGRGRSGSVNAPGTTFAEWRMGDRKVALSSAYRRTIKGWTRFYWQTDVLLRLSRRIKLPDEIAAIVRELETARTLPLSLDELTIALNTVCEGHVNVVAHPTHGDRWEVLPAPSEVQQLARAYLAHAARVLSRCDISKGRRREIKALEIGCGTGYATAAMAALGVAAVGVDVDLTACAGSIERGLVFKALLAVGPSARRPQFAIGDAHHLEFPDGSFDIVHHASVLEHIADPAVAMREMWRVLKPKGLAWIEVDPWFSAAGGHMPCTLDFPWGHARLDAAEFETYLRLHRPYEADAAWRMYVGGFQSPRLAMSAVEAIVVRSGFTIRDWQESRNRYANHYALVDDAVLDECRRLVPDATVRDLMTDSYSMVLQKR